MTFNITQILDIPQFYEKVKHQNLPFKLSYKLSKLLREVEYHTNFYKENFKSLLDTYGKKDENGNFIPTFDNQGIQLVAETSDECYAKIEELRNLEIELPDIYFSLEEFEAIQMTPEEVNIIMPFIQV
jgi:hypothetical protein